MKDFRFGAQLFSIRTLCQNAEDFRRSMKEIAKIGYKGVQVSAIGAIEPKEVRAICDENGLEIVCTHVPFKEIVEDTENCIAKHKTYGCKYPGLGGLPFDYYEKGIDGIRQFIKEFNGAADKMAESGMSLLYHNHAHELAKFDGVTPFEVLTRECSPNVQFEIDVYWVQVGGGNPIEYLKGRSSDVIHFKDMVGTRDSKSQITTVGKGNMDWAGIIEACRATRVKWAMVEQDNAVDEPDPIGCLAFAYEFLTKMGVRA